MEKSLKNKVIDTIRDLSFLIRTNDFPIFQKSHESIPDIQWKFVSSPKIENPILLKHKPIHKLSESRNVSCKSCPNKNSGISNFIHNGRIPFLILHSTIQKSNLGFYQSKKKSPKLIFTDETLQSFIDNLFLKELGYSIKEFHIQEYPGCNFPEISAETFIQNVKTCRLQVDETIITGNLKGFILFGTAAIHRFGMEKAKEMTGQIQVLNLGSDKIPFIITRSPEALMLAYNKMKSKLISESEWIMMKNDFFQSILSITQDQSRNV
jgi:hypothetical protein